MDDIFRRARDDEQRVMAQIAELEAELSQQRIQHAKLRSFLELYEQYAQSSSRPLAGQAPLLPHPKLAEMSIADAAEEILKSAGGSMRMTAIIDTLKRAGKVKGNSRSMYGTVFQTLNRSPERFEKARPGFWRLKRRSEIEPPNNGEANSSREAEIGEAGGGKSEGVRSSNEPPDQATPTAGGNDFATGWSKPSVAVVTATPTPLGVNGDHPSG